MARAELKAGASNRKPCKKRPSASSSEPRHNREVTSRKKQADPQRGELIHVDLAQPDRAGVEWWVHHGGASFGHMAEGRASGDGGYAGDAVLGGEWHAQQRVSLHQFGARQRLGQTVLERVRLLLPLRHRRRVCPQSERRVGQRCIATLRQQRDRVGTLGHRCAPLRDAARRRGSDGAVGHGGALPGIQVGMRAENMPTLGHACAHWSGSDAAGAAARRWPGTPQRTSGLRRPQPDAGRGRAFDQHSGARRRCFGPVSASPLVSCLGLHQALEPFRAFTSKLRAGGKRQDKGQRWRGCAAGQSEGRACARAQACTAGFCRGPCPPMH